MDGAGGKGRGRRINPFDLYIPEAVIGSVWADMSRNAVRNIAVGALSGTEVVAVENAILHGLDKRREGGGELDIRLRREGDRLVFSVLDNGPGLSEEMERQLNEPGGQGSGYGVRNVRDRIVLSYGNEYGVRAENRPEGGCAAILTLPVLTNENNCDES